MNFGILVKHLRRPVTRTYISVTALKRHLQHKPQPLLLTGLTRHWNALIDWTEQRNFGSLRDESTLDSLVDVEFAPRRQGYLNPDWIRMRMTLHEFLDMSNRPMQTSPDREVNKIPFVAQQDLFTLIPSLNVQAPCLPHAIHSGPLGQFWRRNCWIGKMTVSPIHRDPYHNLYSQVSGYKRFFLFPPRALPYLAMNAPPPNSNTSLIPEPPSQAMIDLHPPLERAMDLGQRVDLGPGDTLLIPEGWFHAVEALGEVTSISINHWFR